jgi:hypothetical protein
MLEVRALPPEQALPPEPALHLDHHDGRMRDVLEHLFGPVEALTPVRRGYTNNERFVVRFTDGTSAFVKAAVNDETAEWLRREHLMYEHLAGQDIAPRLLGWIDGGRPVLVLEDLTDGWWPPPWRHRDVEAVMAMLARLGGVDPPEHLTPLLDGEPPDDGWGLVLADPSPFLSLGLHGAAWLARVGPALREAAAAAPLAGRSLLHLDVRSDNLCVRGGAALLFDWNLACLGNPQLDVAFWLPSLAMESGWRPEDVVPDCPPELASYVAGFFACRAGQPVIPHAPMVRTVQLDQLRTALPWALRALGVVDDA